MQLVNTCKRMQSFYHVTKRAPIYALQRMWQIYLSCCCMFIKHIRNITGHPFMGWQLKVSQCTLPKTIEISRWYTHITMKKIKK